MIKSLCIFFHWINKLCFAESLLSAFVIFLLCYLVGSDNITAKLDSQRFLGMTIQAKWEVLKWKRLVYCKFCQSRSTQSSQCSLFIFHVFVELNMTLVFKQSCIHWYIMWIAWDPNMKTPPLFLPQQLLILYSVIENRFDKIYWFTN